MPIIITLFPEHVHAPIVVHAIDAISAGATATTDRVDLIAARPVKRIPREQPVVAALGRVRIVHVDLQLGLVEVGQFAVEGGRLRAVNVVNGLNHSIV